MECVFLNNTESNKSYADKLKDTTDRFLASLGDRIQEIANTIEEKPDPLSTESPRRKLHRLLHDLSGSAAMLNLDDVHAAVANGLSAAAAADRAGRSLTDDDIKSLTCTIEALTTISSQQDGDKQ
jgi:HPt (histidine-containing phosphotransfer) domain-containing protein